MFAQPTASSSIFSPAAASANATPNLNIRDAMPAELAALIEQYPPANLEPITHLVKMLLDDYNACLPDKALGSFQTPVAIYFLFVQFMHLKSYIFQSDLREKLNEKINQLITNFLTSAMRPSLPCGRTTLVYRPS